MSLHRAQKAHATIAAARVSTRITADEGNSAITDAHESDRPCHAPRPHSKSRHNGRSGLQVCPRSRSLECGRFPGACDRARMLAAGDHNRFRLASEQLLDQPLLLLHVVIRKPSRICMLRAASASDSPPTVSAKFALLMDGMVTATKSERCERRLEAVNRTHSPDLPQPAKWLGGFPR